MTITRRALLRYASQAAALGALELACEFLADNPGPTLFHCHQQLHMDFGFTALFNYA
jgi:FtsP/CotA-like multicopper oxidase with cupredoxin domain